MILIVITAVQVGEPAVQLEGLGWYLQAAAAAAAALGLQDDVAALAAGGEGSEGGEEEVSGQVAGRPESSLGCLLPCRRSPALMLSSPGLLHCTLCATLSHALSLAPSLAAFLPAHWCAGVLHAGAAGDVPRGPALWLCAQPGAAAGRGGAGVGAGPGSDDDAGGVGWAAVVVGMEWGGMECEASPISATWHTSHHRRR